MQAAHHRRPVPPDSSRGPICICTACHRPRIASRSYQAEMVACKPPLAGWDRDAWIISAMIIAASALGSGSGDLVRQAKCPAKSFFAALFAAIHLNLNDAPPAQEAARAYSRICSRISLPARQRRTSRPLDRRAARESRGSPRAPRHVRRRWHHRRWRPPPHGRDRCVECVFLICIRIVRRRRGGDVQDGHGLVVRIYSIA